MSSEVKERELLDLPGVGEIRGRPGTSTMVLAGAAKFWHDKYQSAKLDGAIAAVVIIAVFETLGAIAYHFWR